MNALERKVYDTIEQSMKLKMNKDSAGLAKLLQEHFVTLEQLSKEAQEAGKISIDEMAKINIQSNMLKTKIEDLITEISASDQAFLLDFSYEFLKLESTSSKKSNLHDILNGTVKPSILVDLICSNFYNSKTGRVEPKPHSKFYIANGDNGILISS